MDDEQSPRRAAGEMSELPERARAAEASAANGSRGSEILEPYRVVPRRRSDRTCRDANRGEWRSLAALSPTDLSWPPARPN